MDTQAPTDPASAETLPALFRARVAATPEATAYIQFDEASQRWVESSWGEMGEAVARWQAAMARDGLQAGDRVAIMLRNCREWVMFDQAAQGLGLVVVPIYTNDRAQNVGYILQDAGVKLLLIDDDEQWQALQEIQGQLEGVARIISIKPVRQPGPGPRATPVDEWLPETGEGLQARDGEPEDLVTIVYTSGTTGRPKGVMLSHRNILFNVRMGLKQVCFEPHDRFLSFLPLSHTFERTVGYYAPLMTGSCVAYARSIPQLGEDLLAIRPTCLVAVPRIFERVHAKIQAKLEQDSAIARGLFKLAVDVGWRRFEHRQGRAPWNPRLLLWPLLEKLVAHKVAAKLGGRLWIAVCGGAALSPEVARLFIGLGIPLVQGYGLTETSPIITANALEDNIPASVGVPLQGIETRVGADGELQTRSPSVMLGYWNNPDATAAIIDPDGWLHTGDKVRVDDSGHVYITGRLKEIIVLANGEKVPPTDMEMAIALDGLIEQVMVVGEAKPYLAALVVPEPAQFAEFARGLGLDPDTPATLDDERLTQALLERIGVRLHSFPGYAQIRRLAVLREPWSVENALMTPTLKLRRGRIVERHADVLARLYEGH